MIAVLGGKDFTRVAALGGTGEFLVWAIDVKEVGGGGGRRG